MSDPMHTSSNVGPVEKNSDQPTTVRLEPVSTDTIIVPTPWYKRMLGGPVVRTQTVWKLTFLSFLLVGVIVGQSMTQAPTNIETQASVNRATISLLPGQVTMPPDKLVQLWISSEAPVKEGTVVVKFDPSIVKLKGSIQVFPKPGYSIVTTATNEANTTGIVRIGISPQEAGIPAMSDRSVHVATFSFSSVSTVDAQSTIAVSLTDSRLVSQDTTLFSLVESPASVSVDIP
jgi:hypothetical protein